MYFHGAGWVMGDSTTHDRLVRRLAIGAGAMLVFVDYDRTPEYRYPVAIEEAYAATCYIADHPEEFGVDATRLSYSRTACSTPRFRVKQSASTPASSSA